MSKTLNHETVSYRTKFFSLLVAGLLSVVAACAVEGTVEEGDATEEATEVEAAPQGDGDATDPVSSILHCTYEFTCPTNGFFSLGVLPGTPTKQTAKNKCEDACPVACLEDSACW